MNTIHASTPRNATTHYQTSFRVMDPNDEKRKRLMEAIYEWVRSKERDHILETHLKDFCFRCQWMRLYGTNSAIVTDTFLSKEGKAWAMHYREVDGELGLRRL